MKTDEIKQAWGEIDPTALDGRLAIGQLANWFLAPDYQFMTLYGGEQQGKTVLAQRFYTQVSALHARQLDLPIPIYLNFEFVFGEAMARERDLSVVTQPLSYFQLAAIEVIRTTFTPDSFGQLPSYSQLVEPVANRRSLVIVDNLERMFANLDWNEGRQSAFYSSIVSNLKQLDTKKTSKFLFMLRPESLLASNRAMKPANPLGIKLQNLRD